MAGEQTTTVQGALPLSYAEIIPAAGFEPATSRVSGEVTLVYTTGRKVLMRWRGAPAPHLHEIRSGNMRARMVLHLEDLHLLALRLTKYPCPSPLTLCDPSQIALGISARGAKRRANASSCGWENERQRSITRDRRRNRVLRHPASLCFVGFALKGAADQLARSDDALKQLWPATGHSCPLSELWL